MGSNRERELAEGETRSQIRTIDPVRRYLREQVDGEATTMSEYLAQEVLPEDPEEDAHSFTEEDAAFLKVTPDVDETIDVLTGSRVHKGEVLAYYCFLDAVENGSLQVAEQLLDYVPEVLWSADS